MRYLAEKVGITEVYAGQSPEQKLELVREETKRANTVFMGDGINDAPALTAATVGIAFGQNSDVTAEAAGAVILEVRWSEWTSCCTSAGGCGRSRCRARSAGWR